LTATVSQWVGGARPRTLPAALSPVIAGSGLAVGSGSFTLPIGLLTLLVSVALQIGVNYANDYSDGVRGTDADRVGPLRLVGSGLARPQAVRAAAFVCFGIAALAGLAVVAITGHWWLLGVGAACVLAAWYYTGGKRPYGYAGLGEIFVFVFFGLVAVCGTVYLQSGRVTVATVLTAIGIGSLACAILVANNLRDIVGDAAVGKRTLATRLGDRRTRILYVALIGVAAVMIVAAAALTSLWALLGLLGLLPIVPALRIVLSGGRGRQLIAVLRSTGLAELLSAIGFAIGVAWSYLAGTSG
jgi:1,4-dihydroxy-2-naphthoate octaprenyltransferase